MIAIEVTGGLANQMFIAARGESWRKEGYDVIYPNVDFAFSYLVTHFDWTRHANEYKTIFKNFNWYDHYKEVKLPIKRLPFMYSEGFIPQDGIEYRGYFQSEKNFYSRELIEWLFEPADYIRAQVDAYYGVLGGTTCSIHVRRGNYLLSKGYHPVQTMRYYEEAMALVGKVDGYLVFSDDLDWCKKNFTMDNVIFIRDKDYVEMFLMSRCTHHIIANSSFSWWGAWLNEKESTRIVAPKVWFGDGKPSTLTEHIVPDRWRRV